LEYELPKFDFTTPWGTDRKKTEEYIKDKNRQKNKYEKVKTNISCKTITQIKIAHY